MKTQKLLSLLFVALFCSASVSAQDPCGLYPSFTESLVNDIPTFTNNSTVVVVDGWHIISYDWNFGDGSGSDLKNPTHVYTDTGTYQVCLILSGASDTGNEDVCYDTVCHDIHISILPLCGTAAFTGQVSGDKIVCVNASTGTDSITSYYWKVYTGSTLVQEGTSQTAFTTDSLGAGNYSVCLYLIHNEGLCDSTCQQFTIASVSCWNINGEFTYTQSAGTDTIHFTSTIDSTDWYSIWNFGDGSSGSGLTPMHFYAQPGTYTVCRYITYHGTACHDTVCQSVTVHNYCSTLTGYWLDSLIQGNTYRFYASDTNTIAHHIWSFGDGSPDINVRDTTHTYTTAGTYTACLYVYIPNSTCPTDSYCRTITIAGGCWSINGEFTYTQSAGTDTIHFTGTVDSTDWLSVWNFGDGTRSTEPVHLYAEAGTYTVCRYITYNGTGCHDTVCQSVTVTSPCPASLTAQWGSYTLTGNEVRFYSYDTNSTAHHIFNFGDGTSASASDTTHTYSSPGIYHVCFYVYIPGGACDDSLCEDITVGSTIACWTINGGWTYRQAAPFDTIYFTSNVDSTDWRTVWTFGDGSSSTAYNPTHLYTQSGTYTVCRIIAYRDSACHDTVCQSVTVTNYCSDVNPNWTDVVLTGTTVEFYAADTVSALHRDWNFGDGDYGFGVDVSHTYSTAGTYHVCLITYVPGACTDSFCTDVTISGVNCSTLTGYWLDSTISSNTFKFKASDTNTIAHHIWSFGDGTPDVNAMDTIHTFTAAGTYSVCLYVYIPNSTCPTDSYCRTITISSGCPTINGAWTYTVSATGDTVHFASVVVDSTDWLSVWNFGDGSLSTESTHVYAEPGTYTVCRAITYDGTACHDTVCQSITVTNANCPPLNAYWLDTLISGNTYRFIAFDTNSTAHHIFSFGDGTYANSTDTTHTYTSPGTYTACLYVYIPGSSCPTDSFCRTITIDSCGTASLYGYARENQIHAFSSSIGTNSSTLYTWKVWSSTGHLVEDTTTNEYAFLSDQLTNGAYTVCLLLYNHQSFCDSACVQFTINNPCLYLNANFTWTQQAGTSDSIEFHSTVDSSTWTYLWNFGDGTSSTEPNLIHHYSQPGTYTVCHIVTYTSLGCSDTICQSVTVSGTPSCGTAQFSYYIYGSSSIHAYNTANNNPSGTIYAWYLWNSDNTLLQSQSSTTSYFLSEQLANGTYRICLFLYASNNLFCDSVCESIVIDSSTACTGLSAYYYPNPQNNGSLLFTPADTSTAHTHYWVFGDGTTSTEVEPTHAYADGGVYQACLYISIPGTNCADTFCRDITVTAAQCNAGFTYVAASNAPNTLVFTNTSTSTDSITGYRWVFGDNTVSYDKNPIHAYPDSGKYYTCLYITSANGCTSSYCDTVHVPYNPCGGLTSAWTYTTLLDGNLQFKSNDTSSSIHRYWTFGDGGTSTNYDPVHAYAQSGTYTVCLLVYVPGTTCIDSTCTTIQVGASGCSAGFTYQSYYPPYDAVRFTNTSTSGDSIISYAWTFGDNTSATFTSGTHTFPHSGYWYVCLTLTTLHGCTSTYCDTIFAQYDPCYGMSAAWTYTYTNQGGVQFSGSTPDTGTYNLWVFGDGTSSDEVDPLHYYAQPGTYDVCHILGIRGSCADTSCQSIQGTNQGSGCHADFTFATDTLNNHAYFTNTSTSSDTITSYLWDFGDGSTSTAESPYNAYANAGTYYVCLTISTANGCSSTYCDSVKVHVLQNSTCSASFTWTVDTCQTLAFTNTSTGGFTNHYWLFGDGSSADTAFNATHLFPVGTWSVQLTVYNSSSGCVSNVSESITVNACGNTGNDTVCGTVFDDVNGNGVQDQGEAGTANAEVHIGDFVVHADSGGHYVAVVPSGTYNIYYCAPQGYTFTIPVSAVYDTSAGYSCAEYGSVNISSGTNCGFNFGIKNNSITICGTVYFDADDDHHQDAGDAGIANAQVILIDSGNVAYTVYTDQYGNYCAVVPAGSYVITIAANQYPGASIYPSSITLSSTIGGSTYNNNNFGVYVAPGTCDLDITVTPSTTVTPGFPAWYEVEVCNVGTNITSGMVNMFYDPGLTYNYASPLPSSQNSSTFTITWTLTNLLPGSCQYYWVSTTADSTLAINAPIFTLATVTTSDCNDINLTNNVDTLHQTVTASWDPNNKTVSPLGEGPSGNIKGNESMSYTINFQNTGTAPAVNIVIHDTLSNNLDINTFKMSGASAPVTTQFNGRVVIWKFNDIMLPDSSVDQQGSHGFVSYTISPVQGLAQGSQITNSAILYFDYNTGASTNTTLNTIDYTLSVNNLNTSAATITLMPNPFGQYTFIRIDGAQAPYEIKVFDMVGQEVRDMNADDNVVQFNRGTLAAGMYMYQIIQNGKILGQGKMIAE